MPAHRPCPGRQYRWYFQYRTAPPFLVSTTEQWPETYSTPQIKDAHSLRCMQFVAGKGQHMNLAYTQVHGNLAHCLNRIRMEHDAFFIRHLCHLFHRENRARLIVCPHDRHHGHPVTQQSRIFIQIQIAFVVHLKPMYRIAFCFQVLAQIQYSRMFNHGGDDFPAFRLGFQG